MRTIPPSSQHDDIHAAKKQLRRQIKAVSGQYSESQLASMSADICQRLTDNPTVCHADIVMAFWPMPSEPDIRPFIRRVYAEGKRVLLPRVTGETTMEFCLYAGDDSLRPVPPYGILEPLGDAISIEQLSDYSGCDDCMQQGRVVMLVPGVAFETEGRRLGHGCGYYDRYLHGLDLRTIGVCFPFQVIDSVPTDGNDVSVEAILT